MTPDEPPERPVRPAGVAEEAISRVFRVPSEAAGKRVDVFMQTQLRNTSRTRASAIVERSAFRPDGRKLRASERLRAEQGVVLWRLPLDENEEPVELPVLYEDEHLLVVDKPALLTVHPTARHDRRTVIRLLQEARPDAFLSLIHRLDQETSGILLVARTREGDRAFKRALEERSVGVGGLGGGKAIEKTYLAISKGVPPSGLIDRPLEPDTDNPLRVKMRHARAGTGLVAQTLVEVLETRGDYALLRCELLTGRQHQIRVHLAGLGFPLVGDKLYGPDERLLVRAADGVLTDEDLKRLELPRHALHAHRYRMTHAVTGEPLEVCAPLADDLREFWQSR